MIDYTPMGQRSGKRVEVDLPGIVHLNTTNEMATIVE